MATRDDWNRLGQQLGGMGYPQSPAAPPAPRPNSFGDAVAAIRNPGTVQPRSTFGSMTAQAATPEPSEFSQAAWAAAKSPTAPAVPKPPAPPGLAAAAGVTPGGGAQGPLERAGVKAVENVPSNPIAQAAGIVPGQGAAPSSSQQGLASYAQTHPVAAVPTATGVSLAQAAGVVPGGSRPPATPSPLAQAALAPPAMPASGSVTREGNSYSGGNIAGDITINGQTPRGSAPQGLAAAAGLVPGQGVSAQNMQAVDNLAFSQGLAAAAGIVPGSGQPGVAAPVVRNSTNDWAARKALENAQTSASSITNSPAWSRGAERDWRGRVVNGQADQDGNVAAYQAMLKNDLALQGAQPGVDLAAMREQGDTQRAGMQVAAGSANAAADRMAALDRTLITERGNNTRAGIAAEGASEAARIRAQQENKPPAGYRWAAGGGLEAIQGGPADPNVRGSKAPLNDVQSKALQFGTRMQTAGAVLDSLAAQGVDQPGLIKRGADAIGLGAAANWTQSGGQQQVEQAQRDFINAVLRRESGAAIADSEFANARQQYFPQVGDTPAVIEQKRKNREIATSGVLAEVPNSEKRVNQVLANAASNAPQATAAPAAASGDQLAELQRRAASNPALAARLKELGY